MKLSNITNLDLIGLVENSTEIFRLPKYNNKRFVEAFLGLGVHRSGFYGEYKPDGTVISLQREITTFDTDEDITLQVEGVVVLDKIPTNNGTGTINYNGYGVLEVDGNIEYDGRTEGLSGGGGNPLFTADIPVVLSGGKTLGRYTNGQIIPATGLTSEQVFNLISQEFLTPSFSSFSMNLGSTVEVGTSFTGTTNAVWGTSNSGNVQANSLIIRDTTNGVDLATGLANDGSETVSVLGPIQKTSEASHTWRIQLTDTQAGTATRNNSVNWRYRIFYGPNATDPTNSAEVRALGANRFTNAASTFNLNTGSTLNKFVLVLPPGRTLSNVIDLDALSVDITANYVDQGNIIVLDAGGNNTTYRLYVMTNAIPYTSNHRHQITIS